jgi:site-specific DNA recombinase
MSHRARPTSSVTAVSGNGHRVRVALYLRVSGEEQTVGRNIEAQLDELKGLVAPSYEVVGVYQDDGISGAIPLEERPEGARLMAAARARRFDKLMVSKLDRLSRSIVDLNIVAKTLDSLGIGLWAQGQEFNQTPTGKAMLNMLGMMAEFERDLIKERTLSGKRFKARTQKRWPGGTVPYGYAYKKGEPGEKGLWRIIDDEAEVLRRIYRLCVEDNLGVSTIADRLSDEGIPSPSAARAHPDHPRAKPNFHVGKRWERSHVARLLRNPSYMGMVLVGVEGERRSITPSRLVDLVRAGTWQEKGLIELRVPPIVGERLWWAAQDKLDSRRRLPNPHYQTWPLQSRITCAARWTQVQLPP